MMLAQVGSPLAIENTHRSLLTWGPTSYCGTSQNYFSGKTTPKCVDNEFRRFLKITEAIAPHQSPPIM